MRRILIVLVLMLVLVTPAYALELSGSGPRPGYTPVRVAPQTTFPVFFTAISYPPLVYVKTFSVTGAGGSWSTTNGYILAYCLVGEQAFTFSAPGYQSQSTTVTVGTDYGYQKHMIRFGLPL